MKVLVTAQGNTLGSALDRRFGRARYLLLVETESNAVVAYDNRENQNAMQGAGIQTAQFVARLGAQKVITGHVGPKAFQTLQAANIPVYLASEGTVAEAVEAFRTGKLQTTGQANVQGHW